MGLVHDALHALWARESRRVHANAEREKTMRIAAERRRWHVRFFNPEGKPDKKRPAGRPWAKEAFAGPEKNVFCGGTADLNAFLDDGDHLRAGSTESLKRLFAKIQLQNHLNEVAQAESLMKGLAGPLQLLQSGGAARAPAPVSCMQQKSMICSQPKVGIDSSEAMRPVGAARHSSVGILAPASTAMTCRKPSMAARPCLISMIS